MRTLILIPCMDQVPTQFCQSLAMLQKEGETAIAFQMGSLIYMAREELAKKAIKFEADYVLWLDSDMVFEPDTFSRLFKTMKDHNASIVSGVYYRRNPPYKPVLFKTFELDEQGAPKTTEFNDLPNDVFTCDGIGFGCVLMSVSVLMDVVSKFGTMFTPIQNVGEDIAFCYRAKQCGYEIYVDPTLELGHVGHYVVTKDLYASMKNLGG